MLQMLSQQGWLSYRQKLRDPHQVLWNPRGYEPWQAVMMFPVMPKDMRDPRRTQIPDPYRDGAFAVDVQVAPQKAPVRNNTIKIIIN